MGQNQELPITYHLLVHHRGHENYPTVNMGTILQIIPVHILLNYVLSSLNRNSLR